MKASKQIITLQMKCSVLPIIASELGMNADVVKNRSTVKSAIDERVFF